MSDDIFKDVVKCPRCGKPEYYGMLTWSRHHLAVCRSCIYTEWMEDNPQRGWTPDPTRHFTFPIYEDGKDYTL